MTSHPIDNINDAITYITPHYSTMGICICTVIMSICLSGILVCLINIIKNVEPYLDKKIIITFMTAFLIFIGPSYLLLTFMVKDRQERYNHLNHLNHLLLLNKTKQFHFQLYLPNDSNDVILGRGETILQDIDFRNLNPELLALEGDNKDNKQMVSPQLFLEDHVWSVVSIYCNDNVPHKKADNKCYFFIRPDEDPKKILRVSFQSLNKYASFGSDIVKTRHSETMKAMSTFEDSHLLK